MGGTDGRNGVGWMVDFAGKERLTIQVDRIVDGVTFEQVLAEMRHVRDQYLTAEAAYEQEAIEHPQRAAAPQRECAVYRFYDATARLLYVGKAIDPVARQKQHEKRVWWADVDQSLTGVTWYPSERAALDAEDQAIRDENPIYNRVGGGRR